MLTRPRGSSRRLRKTGRTSMSTTTTSSVNWLARARRLPSASNTMDAPSKTSSSWAADLVDVDERAGCVGGAGRQHVLTGRQPAGEVRRGVDVHDELGAAEALHRDRAVGAPGVLADAHPDADAADDVQVGALGAGREVALLVEHGVVRQEALAVHTGDLPADADGGGVVQVPAGIDEADDGGAAPGASGDLGQRSPVVGHEPWLQDQVLGRVARDGQLREGGQVGAGGVGGVECLHDAGGVAVQVTDRGVHLAEGDADPAHQLGGYRPRPIRGTEENQRLASPSERPA